MRRRTGKPRCHTCQHPRGPRLQGQQKAGGPRKKACGCLCHQSGGVTIGMGGGRIRYA